MKITSKCRKLLGFQQTLLTMFQYLQSVYCAMSENKIHFRTWQVNWRLTNLFCRVFTKVHKTSVKHYTSYFTSCQKTILYNTIVDTILSFISSNKNWQHEHVMRIPNNILYRRRNLFCQNLNYLFVCIKKNKKITNEFFF